MTQAARKLAEQPPIPHPHLRVIEDDPAPIIPASDPEIPYYDAEFDVAQSIEHTKMIGTVGTPLRDIAREHGLIYLSDNPMYYPDPDPNPKLDPEDPHRLGYLLRYADLAMALDRGKKRNYARDMLLVVEVVSHTHKQKIHKDTVRQKRLNEVNGVPEFCLIWPELEQDTVLQWFRLNKQGKYVEVAPDKDGIIHSQSVPDFAIKVLPKHEWKEKGKLIVLHKGHPYRSSAIERDERLAEQARRKEEQARRKEEQARRIQAEKTSKEEQARRIQAEKDRVDTEDKMKQLLQFMKSQGMEPPEGMAI